MTEFRDSAQVLKSKGYKITQPRKQILKALEKSQKPVSPYEIQKQLHQQGQHLNHVTIYRILDLFCLLNLAHKVLLSGGYVRCTLGDTEGCHRFTVCRRCGAYQEFADEALCGEESEIAQNWGFCAEHHFSELSGLCFNCQNNL